MHQHRVGVPWWAKIGLKIVLSRVPLDYSFWRRIGLFKHGEMERGPYALKTFKTHFERCWPKGAPPQFTCLEIGPGDTLFSALIARSAGAAAIFLVDTGSFAQQDLRPYKELARRLTAHGMACPQLETATNFAEVLSACHATYLTEGIQSLSSVPTASIDWIWSQAVLEHIRKTQFLPYMRELRRILKPAGKASHRIDLRDHLADSLNNLRFGERLWEKEWLASSGFYTNRLRFSELCNSFREAGFAVDVVSVDRWRELPTPRAKIAAPFSRMADDELLVSGFDVILTCR